MEAVNTTYGVAVIGAGIVGLSIAYTAAQQGHRVLLFERDGKALGATIRNFGMIWPIGQPATTFDRAMRARQVWLNLAEQAGFWARPWGSLHLAYQEEELNVLEEFIATTRSAGYCCRLLTPEETVAHSSVVNPVGLLGAMYSETEVNIDPREATAALHRYLSQEMGVEVHYRTAITVVDYPYLSDGCRQWAADRIYVCGGADFRTLFPGVMADSGLVKCKLQMMRTGPQPAGFQLGPNLAAGLTLQHYASFAHCEALALLKQRIARELGDYNRWGIHVLLSQTRQGELTIGDSHEYGADVSPFDKEEINALILQYLRKFARLPAPAIAETWNGTYAKLPGKTEFIARPQSGVTIVNGLGGAGMTLSFGLAEELLAE